MLKEKINNIIEKFKSNNKLKIILIIVAILILFAIVSIFNLKHLFGWFQLKTVDETNTKQFVYSSNNSPKFYSYMGEILMLDNKKITMYNLDGKESWTYSIDNVSDAIIYTEGSMLLIAQKNSNTVYVFDNKELKYTKQIPDATISNLYVNKNGYIAITHSKSGYKTIIGLYKITGEEIFNVFLTTSSVSTLRISDDNKYLAFAEVDTSKITASTSIKFIKLDGKQDDIIQMPLQDNTILVNMEFYTNDAVICLFDSKISIINVNKNINDVADVDPKKYSHVDIDNKYYVLVEKPKTIFDSNVVNIYDYSGKHTASYTSEKQIKSIDIKDKTIVNIYEKGSSYYNIWGSNIKTFDSNIGAKQVLLFNGNKNVAVILVDKVYILDL